MVTYTCKYICRNFAYSVETKTKLDKILKIILSSIKYDIIWQYKNGQRGNADHCEARPLVKLHCL